jgi:hypothetical protein
MCSRAGFGWPLHGAWLGLAFMCSRAGFGWPLCGAGLGMAFAWSSVRAGLYMEKG